MKTSPMNKQSHQARLLLFLAILSLSCSSITIALKPPTAEPFIPAGQIGFDYASQTPASPDGDGSAPLHLFLHKYRAPSDGFITAVAYLNDGDTVSESFDLLILRPDNNRWKVIYRITLSDDHPSAKTGITMSTLPSPFPVQKNDIFAHWQYEADGAIPLNTDNEVLDGFSVGQYDFRSADVEIGQSINKEGFSGQRDYFINLIFTTAP